MPRGQHVPAEQCGVRLQCRHMLFAWLSLGWVAFTDLYIRLVAGGTITDLRLF